MHSWPYKIVRLEGGQYSGGCHQPWLAFNRQLDREADGLPNEAVIEGWLADMAAIDVTDQRVYWLTTARITELTLKQAGDYADCGEYRAAGDLLANPRSVDVYVRGWPTPVTKQRHMALSRQFAPVIGDADPVAWLTRETLIHIRQVALLPHLKASLQSSGFIAPTYIADLERRMAQVADTLAFLAAWQVTDSTALVRRMQTASPADRELLQARSCGFDVAQYHALGEAIANVVTGGSGAGRFLIPLRNATRR